MELELGFDIGFGVWDERQPWESICDAAMTRHRAQAITFASGLEEHELFFLGVGYKGSGFFWKAFSIDVVVYFRDDCFWWTSSCSLAHMPRIRPFGDCQCPGNIPLGFRPCSTRCRETTCPGRYQIPCAFSSLDTEMAGDGVSACICFHQPRLG